jgi:MFS family permease
LSHTNPKYASSGAAQPPRLVPPPTPQRRLIRFQRRDLRHNIRCSLQDGAGFSFMVGLGETYLPAFVLALGMGEVNSGLIAAVPLMAGAFMQLASPFMVQLLGSYRRWVVICASLQCAIFVPFIIAAGVGSLPSSLAFLLAALYWGAGMGAGPAWNGWMGRNIAIPVRTHFFARRTRITQIGTLVGFILGGMILQWLPTEKKTLGFAVLFSLSFVARYFSVRKLSRQTEDPEVLRDFKPPSPLSLVRVLTQNKAGGQLFAYVFLLQFGVYFSSPFLTPYMLEQLKVGYLGYVLLVSASYLSKILFLPAMAAYAKRYGTKRLMWIAGVGVILLPVLWLPSTNFAFLVGVQFSGFFWSAFDLGFPLLVLETIGEKDRMNVLVLHNFCQSAVIVTSALIAATFLDGLGKNPGAYSVIFTLSTVLRFTALGALARFSPPRSPTQLNWRMLNIRPYLGDFFVPVIESVRPRRSRAKRRPKAA